MITIAWDSFRRPSRSIDLVAVFRTLQFGKSGTPDRLSRAEKYLHDIELLTSGVVSAGGAACSIVHAIHIVDWGWDHLADLMAQKREQIRAALAEKLTDEVLGGHDQRGSLYGGCCDYPNCNCPFDAPADPTWCARGLPHAPRRTPNVEANALAEGKSR